MLDAVQPCVLLRVGGLLPGLGELGRDSPLARPRVRLATRWSHCSWQKTPQDGPMIVAGDTDQADTGKQNHRMHILPPDDLANALLTTAVET